MRRIPLLEKDMALVSARETVDLPRSASVDSCPTRFPSLEVAPVPRQLASEPRQSASEPGQLASEPRQSSSGDSVGPIAGGSSDRSDTSSSSPKRSLDDENQSPIVLRSEEYRQLFRLPPDEVLVQDFNCAFQESILLQGHMYLFINHICFYSNIFGFETKKIISFHEVTSVKRAKTAGIFPNAIEIFAGEKKYFFASFLSRDEAFKLIHDNWLERGNDVNTAPERQDSISEAGSQENKVVIENSSSPVDMTGGLDSSVRNGDAVLNHPQPPESSKQSDALTSDSNVGQHAETTVNIGTSSPTKSWTWKLEDSSAPKIPGDYTKVAETKFMIKVEDFFMLFFSDSAVNFVESFHKTCGDKEFRCTSWRPHEKFGHTRDVSFQHPIKIYFGAKFGSCQEMQKFKVYRNRHLVIETSQEISDVPYGDYFTVEGLYDVQRESIESKEACKLQVYINVAFSKRTVWKGKIVQSTVEECREVYAAWIEKAHALLKEKNLEKETGSSPVDNVIQNNCTSSEGERRTEEPIEPTQNSQTSSRVYLNPRAVDLFQRSLRNVTSVASTFRDASVKSCSFLRKQSNISQVLVIAFAVILLLQVTILVLLNRPQHIHIPPPPMGPGWGNMGDRSAETISWMEKRVHYLKDEMLMVESRLQTMWHEHAVLKSHLKDLEQLQKQ